MALDNWNSFLAITKVDAEQRVVEGFASSKSLDSQDDVVDPAAIKAALPDYLEWGNIREMHGNSAAGVTLEARVIDGVVKAGGKDVPDPLYLKTRIVDDQAWKKVREGVYKGFSIGGKVTDSRLEKRSDGASYRVITGMKLVEISLVDRPANPDARILLWKGEGMADTDAGTEPVVTHEPAPAAPAEDAPVEKTDAPDLAELISKAIDAKLPELAKALQPQQTAVEKPAPKKAEIKKAAAPDPSKVVAMLQDLRNQEELTGDIDAAQMITQAIALVMQSCGDTEDDAAGGDGMDDAPAAGDAMTAAAQADVKKAGRTFSTGNAQAMHNCIRALAGMLAAAGDPVGQKVAALYAGGDAQQPPMDQAKMADAIGGAIVKVVSPLVQRLDALERQPAPGGPVLKQAAAKVLPDAPAQPAQPQTAHEEAAILEKMLAEEKDMHVREFLQDKLGKLQLKLALQRPLR